MMIGAAGRPPVGRPVAASSSSYYQSARERLKAAPYGDERDKLCGQILDELDKKPGLSKIVAAARDWGLGEDDFALGYLLEELDGGERDPRQLALRCTPLLASDATLAKQLDSFGCKLARELWDATDWKSVRQSVRSHALAAGPEDTPLSFAWSVKSACRFLNPPQKVKVAEVFYRAIEADPRVQWVTESLDAWGVPRTWETLEKASEVWSSERGVPELAMRVTDGKDFARQRKQLQGTALALHDAVAEPKKHYVWQEALRRPEQFPASYFGLHYSVGKAEDQAVYRAAWPALKDRPSAQLAERWGLINIEAVKWVAQNPEVKDPWPMALSITPRDHPDAMRLQLGELDFPAGKLARQLAPHLNDEQLRDIWEKSIRLRKNTSEEQALHLMRSSLRVNGVTPEQSLPIVKLLWKDCERTSEQVPVVQSLTRIAVGEGLDWVVDKLLARPLLSEGLRGELTALREEGPTWEKLTPLLKKLEREGAEEEAMRKMLPQEQAPSSGIKEGQRAIEVGGVRLPKRRTL